MKKKLTFKQEQKRAKALNIIKWICAGLGWSALLTCLILLLSLGVKGCDKKQTSQSAAISEVAIQEKAPKKAKSFDYEYLYTNAFTLEDNNQSVYSSYLFNVADLLGYSSISSLVQNDVVLYQRDIEGAYNTNSGFNEIFELKVTLSSVGYNSTGYYRYILKECVLYATNGDSQACFQFLGWVNPTTRSEAYVIFYLGGSRILLNADNSDSDLLHIALLNPFYNISEYEPNTYTLNEQINFNAFKNTNLEMPYINQSDSGAFSVYDGFFYSGGELFNNITIRYIDAGGTKFIDKNGNVIQASSGDTYYMALEYHNTYTNRTLIVNSRDYTTMKEGSGVITAALLSSTWKTQAYRQIKLIDNPSESDIATIGRLNNNSSNINNGVSGSGSIGGVFDLLANAFGAFSSIINIQLLPGLTLGLFIFLPVIVTIIVLVFKAVKK